MAETDREPASDAAVTQAASASGSIAPVRCQVRPGPGQPLRPWTIPNVVGYVRLAAIPVFCVLAFNSGDGRAVAPALIYLAIALGDYLDGFLARATGQYSRAWARSSIRSSTG